MHMRGLHQTYPHLHPLTRYRIIKEFYVPCIPAHRPKIFGMTASPVDAKVDVIQAAKYLLQVRQLLFHS